MAEAEVGELPHSTSNCGWRQHAGACSTEIQVVAFSPGISILCCYVSLVQVKWSGLLSWQPNHLAGTYILQELDTLSSRKQPLRLSESWNSHSKPSDPSMTFPIRWRLLWALLIYRVQPLFLVCEIESHFVAQLGLQVHMHPPSLPSPVLDDKIILSTWPGPSLIQILASFPANSWLFRIGCRIP